MKVLAVFALFVAFAAALPAPYPQAYGQNDLLTANANPQLDNAVRSKRFIFFSKVFVPYTPVTYTKVVAAAPVETVPVVTPVVKKTKVVVPAPVTYEVKPVTYQYTYSIPSYTVVKAVPAVHVEAQVPAVATATVTKTTAVATETETATDESEE
ncbi:uncharacterized protein LOC129567664 [Sitodiplosis mosellana]|uniref:uncharacterized protein LOC129567664 n=1 Tax=Sitodiplosis mosellana TaxID=263140 RepID=UPI00244436E0|nr:uncharacterized protein LOC129567664 [Sitodiplosis mosellana]